MTVGSINSIACSLQHPVLQGQIKQQILLLHTSQLQFSWGNDGVMQDTWKGSGQWKGKGRHIKRESRHWRYETERIGWREWKESTTWHVTLATDGMRKPKSIQKRGKWRETVKSSAYSIAHKREVQVATSMLIMFDEGSVAEDREFLIWMSYGLTGPRDPPVNQHDFFFSSRHRWNRKHVKKKKKCRTSI